MMSKQSVQVARKIIGNAAYNRAAKASSVVESFLNFHQLPILSGQTTSRWDVENKTGFKLGQIKWFPSFRKYSFFPNPNTVFDNKCLAEITTFLHQQMQARQQCKTSEKII